MSHLLIDTVATLHARLDDAADAQATFLPTSAKADLLRELTRAEARVSALKLRVLAASADVAEEGGAHNIGAWLGAHARLDRRGTNADAHLATDLEHHWPRLSTSLTAGAVNLPQARVIAGALIEVTPDLDAQELLEAERAMIREAERIDEQEQRAAVRTRLSLHSQGDGTTRIAGLLPNAVAQRLEKALDSIAQPRLHAADTDGLRTPRHRLLALALGDLLERINPEKLPAHGGDATTVAVTITLDQLRTQLGTGGLGFDDHTPISAAQARRLACNAHIIPMVLDGAGQVLDAGRAARLHTPMMRKVIRLRDKTCQATGCAIPAEWCDIHHWKPWSHGGKTSVKDGGLLCAHHYQRIHSPHYEHTRQPNGTVAFRKSC